MSDSRTLPDLPNKPGKSNWVERAGGLPSYIERIAKHLHSEKGMDVGRAIATAVNVVKKMCATGDTNAPGKQSVNAGSRAEACKAVAEWERKKKGGKVQEALALIEADRSENGRAPWPTVPECEAILEAVPFGEAVRVQEAFGLRGRQRRDREGQFADVPGVGDDAPKGRGRSRKPAGAAGGSRLSSADRAWASAQVGMARGGRAKLTDSPLGRSTGPLRTRPGEKYDRIVAISGSYETPMFLRDKASGDVFHVEHPDEGRPRKGRKATPEEAAEVEARLGKPIYAGQQPGQSDEDFAAQQAAKPKFQGAPVTASYTAAQAAGDMEAARVQRRMNARRGRKATGSPLEDQFTRGPDGKIDLDAPIGNGWTTRRDQIRMMGSYPRSDREGALRLNRDEEHNLGVDGREAFSAARDDGREAEILAHAQGLLDAPTNVLDDVRGKVWARGVMDASKRKSTGSPLSARAQTERMMASDDPTTVALGSAFRNAASKRKARRRAITMELPKHRVMVERARAAGNDEVAGMAQSNVERLEAEHRALGSADAMREWEMAGGKPFPLGPARKATSSSLGPSNVPDPATVRRQAFVRSPTGIGKATRSPMAGWPPPANEVNQAVGDLQAMDRMKLGSPTGVPDFGRYDQYMLHRAAMGWENYGPEAVAAAKAELERREERTRSARERLYTRDEFDRPGRKATRSVLGAETPLGRAVANRDAATLARMAEGEPNDHPTAQRARDLARLAGADEEGVVRFREEHRHMADAIAAAEKAGSDATPLRDAFHGAMLDKAADLATFEATRAMGMRGWSGVTSAEQARWKGIAKDELAAGRPTLERLRGEMGGAASDHAHVAKRRQLASQISTLREEWSRKNNTWSQAKKARVRARVRELQAELNALAEPESVTARRRAVGRKSGSR